MIVTGVIHNSAAAWLFDDLCNAIDLDYETYKADTPNHDCYDWESNGDETLLFGFVSCDIDNPAAWFAYTGQHGSFAFRPDENAEYSAISNVPYTQIVRSRWAARCMRCSPCYPGQGDLDTPGSDYLAYCLPPSMFDSEDEFDISRIKEIEPCD